MKILFDVNVVVDLYSERIPYLSEVLQIQKFSKNNGYTTYLYTGSVQTLHYVLARAIKKPNQNLSNSLSTASGILNKTSVYFKWWPALSEDGSVFHDIDPEDAQLIKAVNRMGVDALILTRDKELLARCDKAISPDQFLVDYVYKNINKPIQFCDLQKQLDEYRPELESGINQVIESTSFINGPAVKTLAKDLSSYSGVKHSIPCASGTDALLLAFMSLDVKPGDEIIVPAFTFIATGSMVSFYKAVPVFADVDPHSFNINPEEIEKKITDRTVYAYG